MSTYSGSKAQVGRGTILSIGPLASATGTPAYVPVLEVKKSSFKESWDKIDVSNFNSGVNKEYAQTMIDGTITLSGNRVSTDAGQAAVAAAFLNPGAYLFKLTYPLAANQTTTPDTRSFNALVMSYSEDVDVANEIDFSVDLQIVYADTLVVGS